MTQRSITSADEVMFLPVIVRLFLSRITQSFQVISINGCRTMHYCCGKNLVNFGADPTQNGRLTTIFDSCEKHLSEVAI